MGSCSSSTNPKNYSVKDFLNGRTAPLFHFRGNVKDVKPICEAAKEAFKKKYTSKEYKDYHSNFAKSISKTRKVRKIQYNRWRWAQANMETYINELRVSGFSDTQIQDMLNGCPLCFAGPTEYMEFSAACSQLCRQLESADNHFRNIRVVVTGSSVPGFSQNPMKGITNQPSKITSPAKSDVDICFVVDGVTDWIKSLKLTPEQHRLFPSTCAPHASTTRVGLKGDAFAEFVPKELSEFYTLWGEKLSGGLQITFQDSGADLPPWEIYMPIDAY